MIILGISAFYHDSAVAIIKDGEILFAAQEERFSRIKHDSAFPEQALKAGFKQTNLKFSDIDFVVYYDKPWLKFERIVETYYGFAPNGYLSFKTGLPTWIKEKIFLPKLIHEFIPDTIPLKFSTHHMSHAASAFYPGPFEAAAVLTMDGVGEWATTTISLGRANNLQMLKTINFPHSLGLLYSSFTYYCGFKVNSGEYKLMGLAPYGRKNSQTVNKYKSIITTKLCKIFEDGSFWLDQKYFSYCTELEMTHTKSWEKLFDLPRRNPESHLQIEYCDLALAIQEITEEIVIKLARTAKNLTGARNLCLAGGVALNCVANGALLKEKIFENIWIQPAAGDAGGAIGAALGFYYSNPEHTRQINPHDSMKGAFLGQSYSIEEINDELNLQNIISTSFKNNKEQNEFIAKSLAQNNVVGWFKGKMEFGPRSLGARSILASAMDLEMQKTLNLKIKFRESFRPFAPIVLEEDLAKIFENAWLSPYMLVVDQVKEEFRNNKPLEYENWSLEEKLYFNRSKFQTITHLDYSARIQSVDKFRNEQLHDLLAAYKKESGFGILANTSFNVRGEPIVASPSDALKCFFQTDMDILVLEDFVIEKSKQSSQIKEYFKSMKSEVKAD